MEKEQLTGHRARVVGSGIGMGVEHASGLHLLVGFLAQLLLLDLGKLLAVEERHRKHFSPAYLREGNLSRGKKIDYCTPNEVT